VKCPSCGLPVSGGVGSCRGCGTVLPRVEPAVVSSPASSVDPLGGGGSVDGFPVLAPARSPQPAVPQQFVGALTRALLALLGAVALFVVLGGLVVPGLEEAAPPLILAIAPVLLLWLHRVTGNAEVSEEERQRGRRPPPTWGWFVPLANLWFSYHALTTVWRSVRPGERRPPWLVIAWWGCWWLSWPVGTSVQITDSYRTSADGTSREVRRYLHIDFFATWPSLLLLAAAAVLLAVVVYLVTVGRVRSGSALRTDTR